VLEIAKSTACLMLKSEDGELLDYQFINKYVFDNFMTNEELQEHAKNFLLKNKVVNFRYGGLV
jgi:hypothetical protein